MWFSSFFIIALLSIFLIECHAAGLSTSNIDHAKCRTNQKSYDFIIVGGDLSPWRGGAIVLKYDSGGTAGLVLANRLTESGNQTVLVLEAGGLPTLVAASETPGADQQISGKSSYFWFTTSLLIIHKDL